MTFCSPGLRFAYQFDRNRAHKREDGHPDAVADVLEHESMDTTHKHYGYSSNARRRAMVKGLNV